MTERENSPAESSFDELARDLASGTVSRRRALSLVGAALFGAPLGALDVAQETDAADKKKRRRRRRRNNNNPPPPPPPPGQSFACANIFSPCGLGTQTLVCFCTLSKEGAQQCANFVNPPNGAAFQACQTTANCPAGQVCEITGNVCRTLCPTA